MKIAQLSVLAVLALAAQGAFAQSSPDPRSSGSDSRASGSSSSGASQAGGGSATDASAVTNAGSLLATDTTVDDTTTTSTGGDFSAPMGEMANTGGEPELMLLAGFLLATGGLLIRRKTSAQSL